MKIPRRILCATDLTPGSDAAILEADAWARRHGSLLAFLHVIPDAGRMHVLFPQFAQKAFKELPDLSRRAAEAVAERVAGLTSRAPGDFEVLVDLGSPAAVIVSVAEEMAADLVVIGGAAEKDAAGSLGSVALRVIQHGHGPVLLVRSPTGRGPVLVASDLSDPSFPAISAGFVIASAMGENLTVLHVSEPPPAPLPMPEGLGSGFAYTLSAHDLQLLREDARDRLTSALTRLGVKGQCLVEEGSVARNVVSAARRLDARLLVIGTEGRTGLRRMLLGSTAEQILRDASGPVLVVRLHGHGAVRDQ